MAVKQVKSLVQFTRGSSLVWTTLVTPIPDGVITFSIDDGVFKLGDGITLYSALPVLFTYNDLVSAQGGISALFQEPTIEQNGKIVVITMDAGSNEIKYSVSATSLADLLAMITQLETENTDQNTAIATLLTAALSIDVSINVAGNDVVVVSNSRRFSSSGDTVDNIRSQVQTLATYEPGSHLLEPKFYTDAAKSREADKMQLIDGNTYYVEVAGFNNLAENVVYGLSAANSAIVITPVSGPLFAIQCNNVTDGIKEDVPVALIVSVDDGTGNSTMKKAVACLVQRQRILVSIYGGTSTDTFSGAVIDLSDNIFCIGHTYSEGLGNADALVVKFDNNLNILAKKRYGGTNYDRLIGITTDSVGNIYACGHTLSEGLGGTTYGDALVVKFDNNLNILAKKRYGGTGDEQFTGITISQTNIYVSGYTTSEGLGNNDALVVKFDNNLNILAKKRYGGTGNDHLVSITTDSVGNIYACGHTLSEGLGGTTYGDALVVKFDNNLNILAKKRYGGTGDDIFHNTIADYADNIYCVGYTTSEGIGGNDALVVKFDSNLNILAKKRYGGTGNDIFGDIIVVSDGDIICTGYTGSEGLGNNDALVVKFDNNLNILAKKRYGGTGTDVFNSVIIDSRDNVICIGNTASITIGNYDALIVKFPENIPSGTFTGSILSGLTLADITTLTLSDSNLTFADVTTSTLADSALTLADITTLTLGISNLTQEKDTLN